MYVLQTKEVLFERGQQYIWMIRLINSVSQYTEISTQKAQCYLSRSQYLVLFRHRLDDSCNSCHFMTFHGTFGHYDIYDAMKQAIKCCKLLGAKDIHICDGHFSFNQDVSRLNQNSTQSWMLKFSFRFLSFPSSFPQILSVILSSLLLSSFS